jgi:hypothetical protein
VVNDKKLFNEEITHHFDLGVFIGSSFVFKKKGLLEANEKSGKHICNMYK